MRIYEVDSTGTDLVLLFRNTIAKYNHAEQPAHFTWDELNAEMQGSGSPQIDYRSFGAMYDQDPELWKSVVRSFNGEGVELNTKAKQAKKAAPTTPDKRRANIHKMAKSAAAKRLG
jgi:hypothetical protein